MTSSRTDSPIYQAGCRMPSDKGIERQDEDTRTLAEIVNERFVEALQRCIANGGAA